MQASPASGVARDMYRRGQKVRSRALQLAGADTGRLRASIHVELTQHGGIVGARIGSNVAYAAFHHEGHGVIRPVRAQVLVFHVQGRWVFTKQVRAVPGTEYLRRALPAARD
jgi:phage gpG-like protein